MRKRFILAAVAAVAGCQTSSHAIIFKPGVNMPAHPLPQDDMKALVAYLETLK